jgi:phosphatidylserine/phosphatidylglycerophosphate/cardiolipin synthase-like enzyme
MNSSRRRRTTDRKDGVGRRSIWVRLLGWLYRRLGWKGRVVLVAVVLLAIAASFWLARRWPWEGEPTTAPFAETEGVVGLYVLPDDGHEPILTELAAARQSVTLQIYLLTDEEIFAALKDAADRGVRVRVLLEEDPFGGPGTEDETYERLARAGVDVRWSDPEFRFSHVKTFVIDEHVAIVMNLNLTTSAFTQNREFFAITTQAPAVAQAAAIFEADWERSGAEIGGPLVVSPTNSRTVLLDLIDGATETLDLYAEVVRDGEMVAALIAAEDRGVAVRLIVSPDSEEDDQGRFERDLLRQAGADVRLAKGLYIHAKMILADEETLFIGSQNLTATSLDDNREIGILITDAHALARASAIFASDFVAAVPEEIAGAAIAPAVGLTARHDGLMGRTEVLVLDEREWRSVVVTLAASDDRTLFLRNET